MSERVVHRGMPGHFIAARSCCFRLHSVVDARWKVSTVGCYHGPDVYTPNYSNRTSIGAGRLYETMVFDLESEDPLLEIDFEPYNDEESAEAGHFAMIEKWSAPYGVTAYLERLKKARGGEDGQ